MYAPTRDYAHNTYFLTKSYVKSTHTHTHTLINTHTHTHTHTQCNYTTEVHARQNSPINQKKQTVEHYSQLFNDSVIQ